MREVSLRMAGYLSDQAAKGHAPRAVRCIHCAETMHVSTKAETATCPRCYKRQTVQDVIVDTEKMGARVETTGILFIKKKGRVWAPGVKAGEAVEVLGELKANVETKGHVVIGETARWRGDCKARLLVVEEGARIEGGFFCIDPHGHFEAERAAENAKAVENAAQAIEAKPTSPLVLEPAAPVHRDEAARPAA